MNCMKHITTQIPSIDFRNIKRNERFFHSIVLIKGTVLNYNHRHGETNVSVSNEYNSTNEILSLTNDGNFKTIVRLVHGENVFVFKHCCTTKRITLAFERQEDSKFKLNIYYVICQNHDGSFQSDRDSGNTVQSACKRINLVIELIQCFYAEMLLQNGFERKTFDFIECKPFQSELTVEQAREWSPHKLWQYHAKEFLCKEPNNRINLKYFGILASTLFINDELKGNAALGIGDVALYGSGTMYSWPAEFQDIQESFHDKTLVDTKQLLDDSNGRKTFGGCFTTALGAMCHEIGHIFDLGHTHDGIMGNDIDYVNRLFVIERFPRYLPARVESTCVLNSNQCKMNTDQRLTKLKKTNPILSKYHNRRTDNLLLMTENCAVIINSHKWFNQSQSIDWYIKRKNEPKIIVSKLSLILIEFRTKSNGLTVEYYRFAKEQKQIQFEISSDKFGKDYDLFAIDQNGNIEKFSIDYD